MKTIAVLAALAAVAAASSLPGYYTGHGFRSAPYRLPAQLRREKKSSQLTSDITFTGEPIPQLKSVPEAEARTFKKPIIVKKKFGYHHLYRDSDEERAASNDPQESCGKEVTVKLCDPERINRRHAPEGTASSLTNNEMKHSIQMAKEAVENIQKATQFQKIEVSQDAEIHDDIEKARQALAHIQENFGNLESMNLKATTINEAQALHGGTVHVARTDSERVAQWAEAIENIQKNAEIARNIEDGFKAAQETQRLEKMRSSGALLNENAEEHIPTPKPNQEIASLEGVPKKANLKTFNLDGLSEDEALEIVKKSKSTENIEEDLSTAASAPVVQTVQLESASLEKSSLKEINENKIVAKSNENTPTNLEGKINNKAVEVDTTMLMKSVDDSKQLEILTDSANNLKLKSSENAQQLESHMPPFFKSSENVQHLESHVPELKSSENVKQIDSQMPPFLKSTENAQQLDGPIMPPFFKSSENVKQVESHMPPFFKSSENVQHLDSHVPELKSSEIVKQIDSQMPPFFKSTENAQQIDGSMMPPFFKSSEKLKQVESHMPPFFKASENEQHLDAHVPASKSSENMQQIDSLMPPFFKASENAQQLDSSMPPFFKASENMQHLDAHVPALKSSENMQQIDSHMPPFFKASDNTQKMDGPIFFKSSENSKQVDSHMPPFFKASDKTQQLDGPIFFKSSENAKQVDSHMPPFFKASDNTQQMDGPIFFKSSENAKQVDSHMPPFFKSSEDADQMKKHTPALSKASEDLQQLGTHVVAMKTAQRPSLFKSSDNSNQLDTHMPPFFKSSDMRVPEHKSDLHLQEKAWHDDKMAAKFVPVEDKERSTMVQMSSGMIPSMNVGIGGGMFNQPMMHHQMMHRPLQQTQTITNTMFGKSVDMESATKPSTKLDDIAVQARGAYGAYGAPAGASAGSGPGAVGVFPGASVGNCAVPLLLSCSPSVVPGTLAHAPAYPAAHAPAYPAPHAYRSANGLDHFHNKRDARTIKELNALVKRTPAKEIQKISLNKNL
ncbi:hypothetical protein O0L34_g7328 [Tuta absoluta]|nr:hypothetical protein O0L34_g7328 [Tuta absoluta]